MSVNEKESIRPDIVHQWNLQKLLGSRPVCDRLKIRDYAVESDNGEFMEVRVMVDAYKGDNPEPLYEHLLMLQLPSDAWENYEDPRELLYYMFEFLICKANMIDLPHGIVEEKIKTGNDQCLCNMAVDFEERGTIEALKKEQTAKDVEWKEAEVDVPRVLGNIVDDESAHIIDDGADERIDEEVAPCVTGYDKTEYGSEYAFETDTASDPEGITVCIPTFNIEQYIVRTLDSVRNQTHPYFKVLIRDDRSTDDTVPKIQAYIKRYGLDWTLVINPENLGVNLTRALLAEEAETSHVLFMDDDDYFVKNTAIEELSQHLDNDVIGFAIESPRILGLKNTRNCPAEGRSLVAQLLYREFIGRPSFVYRRSLFSGFVWYRYHNYTEDYYMNMYIFLRTASVHIHEEALYHWSERYGSLSTYDDNAEKMKSLWFYRKKTRELMLESDWFKNNPEAAVRMMRGHI